MPAFVEWPSAPIASACRIISSGVSRKHASPKPMRCASCPKSHTFGSRLARRRNRLLRELHKVVPVRSLHVRVFQKRRRRQHEVRVIGGVGKKLLVHHGEEIVALQAAPHRVVIRRHRARIRVVHKQRMHRRPVVLLPCSLAPLLPSWSQLRQRPPKLATYSPPAPAALSAKPAPDPAAPAPSYPTQTRPTSKAARRRRASSTRPSTPAASQSRAPPRRHSPRAARRNSAAAPRAASSHTRAPVAQSPPGVIPVQAATRSGVYSRARSASAQSRASFPQCTRGLPDPR